MRGCLCPKRQGTLREVHPPGREPTSHDIPPGTVPDRVRSPACAGGCTAAAAVMFFPGGAADEITARRSLSRRRSGLVSTNWGTLSTRKATLSTDMGHTWDSIQGTLSTTLSKYGYSWCSQGTTTHYSYRT